MENRFLKLQAIRATLITFSFVSSAIGGDRSAMEDALKAKYQLTKTGIDRVRITQPGTVLVILQDGISGDLSSDMSFLNNKIRDGKSQLWQAKQVFLYGRFWVFTEA
jgi:hypothetical protein